MPDAHADPDPVAEPDHTNKTATRPPVAPARETSPAPTDATTAERPLSSSTSAVAAAASNGGSGVSIELELPTTLVPGADTTGGGAVPHAAPLSAPPCPSATLTAAASAALSPPPPERTGAPTGALTGAPPAPSDVCPTMAVATTTCSEILPGGEPATGQVSSTAEAPAALSTTLQNHSLDALQTGATGPSSPSQTVKTSVGGTMAEHNSSTPAMAKAYSMPVVVAATGEFPSRQTAASAISRGRSEAPQPLNGPNRASSSSSVCYPGAATPKGSDVVLARSSVPYSDVFPIKDQQVGPQHFRRLKLLGRGGIGRVFLVQLKGTSLLYAMKVLTKEEMIQRNKVKRVMTEREILATANHPFVVTMYASFQTQDNLCFLMEYCAGGEFFKVLQRQPLRRLREEAVRFYAAEVTLALEYLHHMGFIYRDLKPENILLRANGHIALTDFDLSKQAHAVSPRVIQQQLSMSDKIKKSLSIKRTSSNLNNLEIVDSEPIMPYQTNSFVGTEDYISPEIISGVAQSSAVDWWTLGILIYEMLTGTTPFKGSHADETFSNIVHHQVKWPEDLAVSADCKHLVKRLLRREPDKRLGALNGATDIKRSKWFANVNFNFALVRNETPPIIPKIRDPQDFSQYAGFVSGEFDEANALAEGESGDFDNNNPENPFMDFNIRRDSEIVQRKY